MRETDQLAEDIRTIDGDHKMGAGELAEALVALGYGMLPELPEPIPYSLRDYSPGEIVTVRDRNFDWSLGQISEISNNGTNIHVDTESGPVTIASPRRIRKATP